MIQHFLNPFVLFSYLVAITLNAFKLIPIGPEEVFIQTIGLVLIDFMVHMKNHEGGKLSPPLPSIAWAVIVTVCTAKGFIYHGWQISAIVFAQAWWDNSFHSLFNHRPDEKPITHTDHNAIRWAAVATVIVAIALPRMW